MMATLGIIERALAIHVLNDISSIELIDLDSLGTAGLHKGIPLKASLVNPKQPAKPKTLVKSKKQVIKKPQAVHLVQQKAPVHGPTSKVAAPATNQQKKQTKLQKQPAKAPESKKTISLNKVPPVQAKKEVKAPQPAAASDPEILEAQELNDQALEYSLAIDEGTN